MMTTMRKTLPLLALASVLPALALLVPGAARAAEHPLSVHPTGRYLVQANGRPFLYLADTGWELFHRLNRQQAEQYLANRAQKGFTVIQAVVLAELDGLRDPTPNGELPLIDLDPRRPNPRYFEHVDHVVKVAEVLGLTIGMLPSWGDKWHSRLTQPGPKVFDEASALAWGRFIGDRYKNRAVIFILGGDRNPETKEDLAVVRAMGRGLKETAPRNLVTFHPRGPGRSSDYFHKERWLDFNMIQSSHTGRDFDVSVYIDQDRRLSPVKPTLDGEPRYEGIPVDFYQLGNLPHVRFDDYDVRVAAWRALIAGAAGHTYGNNNIWQMWAPGRNPVIQANAPWSDAIDHPGAFQMRHIRRLFESRPWEKLEPSQSMLVQNGVGPTAQRAALASDRSFALVYTPRGETIALDQGRFGGRDLTVWWYDPRYGHAYRVHGGVSTALQAFTPPTSGRGQDWVLVIDDTTRKFPPPGELPAAPKP
jgi:hypothetical protein